MQDIPNRETLQYILGKMSEDQLTELFSAHFAANVKGKFPIYRVILLEFDPDEFIDNIINDLREYDDEYIADNVLEKFGKIRSRLDEILTKACSVKGLLEVKDWKKYHDI